MKGFSRANLFFMRQWFLFYCKADSKVQQLVRQIPWGHNVVIINKNKIKDIYKAEFYIKKSRIQCMMLLIILQQPAAKLEESPHFARVWGDYRESPLRSTGDI